MQKGKYIYYSPESHYGWKQLEQMFQIMTLCKCIFYGLFIYSLVNSHLSCIHLVQMPTLYLERIQKEKKYSLFFQGLSNYQSSSVQSLSRVRLFATPCTSACQASLSITNFWSLPKLMSIESVMPSSHLILCRSLLLLPSIFPNIRVFSNESALRIRWPKYWSFSFNIIPTIWI